MNLKDLKTTGLTRATEIYNYSTNSYLKVF